MVIVIRIYASTRYKNILMKCAPTDHKERLLQEMAIWMKSMDVVEFWKEMKRKDTLHTLKGTNVTNLFRQYQHKITTQVADKGLLQAESDLQKILALSNILFLARNQHSDLKVQDFGCQIVVLRWANKNEETSDIRPDAVITLSKDTIDRYSQDVCFAFQVNGYRISFFMVYRQHQDVYIMVEVASVTFPSSLGDLDALTTKKNLCTLARASSSFWNSSMSLLKSPVSPPISTLYPLIDKSHNKSVGTTSRY